MGGLDITDLLLNEVNWSVGGPEGRSTGSLRLVQDLDNLKRLDWTQMLVLSVGPEDATASTLFSGLVQEVHLGQESDLHVRFSDPGQLLDEARVGGAFGSGLHPSEIIYYLLASVTPNLASPDLIAYDESGSLADRKVLFSPRIYTFIAPLPFIEPPETAVPFLDGLVYAGGTDASIDDRKIASAFENEPPNEWHEGKTRVRFQLEAEGFLSAFERGRDRLRKMLDVLSFAANYASPTVPGQPDRIVAFSRADLNPNIQEPEWLYVRDNLPGKANRHWLRWYSSHLLNRALVLSPQAESSEFDSAWRRLVTRSADLVDGRGRALLSALHALRRSRQAPYESDSLSLLWQVMEFLCAGFDAPIPVSKKLSAAMVKLCVAELRRAETSVTAENLRTMERHVRRGMNLVRSLPLKDKWEALCDELSIEFSAEENAVLWSLRQLRNQELHGSVAVARRGDILRALVMLEKVLIAAVNKWNGSGMDG